MHCLLPVALLAACALTGCSERAVPQQVVDRDPVLLYNALASGIDEIQHKVDANKDRLANAKTPVAFASDRTEGKMIHVRVAALGLVEEMTVWIEPGPIAGKTLLKADLPSRVTRDGGNGDLLDQVKLVLRGDADLIDEVLRSTEESLPSHCRRGGL
jgi:hypothetical protein